MELKIFKNIKELQNCIKQHKTDNQTIGFVPTMGYLHEGHLSLIKKSVKENDITVLSVYVNPEQFSPDEDLDTYPRDFDRDIEFAEKYKVDYLFLPEDKIMYPEGFNTFVEVKKITTVLEGKFRPTHFKGVTTVVAKLFNIVNPDTAYFGQKDAQQAVVITKMVNDLNFDINIRVMPIIRDENGLALSSRNVKLSDSEYKVALELNRTLKTGYDYVSGKQGINSAQLMNIMNNYIKKFDKIELDYISVKRCRDFVTPEKIEEDCYILIAAKVGPVRLIDNIKIKI